MTHKLLKRGALEAKTTAFFLCDIQESFRPYIKHYAEVVGVAKKLLEISKLFNIPVYVSEQDTKNFGHTSKDIHLSETTFVFNKTTFSMYGPELKNRLNRDIPNLESVVLCGIAAHVCVEHTVIDLLHEDINVHILADGVSSKSLMDRDLALQRFQSLGGSVSTSETIMMKLLKEKDHPAFQKVVTLIKTYPTPDKFGAS